MSEQQKEGLRIVSLRSSTPGATHSSSRVPHIAYLAHHSSPSLPLNDPGPEMEGTSAKRFPHLFCLPIPPLLVVPSTVWPEMETPSVCTPLISSTPGWEANWYRLYAHLLGTSKINYELAVMENIKNKMFHIQNIFYMYETSFLVKPINNLGLEVNRQCFLFTK